MIKPIQSLTQSPLAHPIDSDIILELKQLKEENKLFQSNKESIQKQNANYRSIVIAKERENAILKEKLKLFDIAKTKNEEEYIEEVRNELDKKYKQKYCSKTEVDDIKTQLNEKEFLVSSLNVKLEESLESNETLRQMNLNLKNQITKRT